MRTADGDGMGLHTALARGLALVVATTLWISLAGLPSAPAAIAPPRVTGLSTHSLPLRGGFIRVRGSGFVRVTKVLVGGVRATHVRVLSAGSLTADAPARPAGHYAVRVVAAGGTSPLTVADRLAYIAPPAISSVTPATGSSAGGTSVTIKGSRFLSISRVLFGTTRAASFSVSSGVITAHSPTHGAGTIDVRVVGRYGTSPTTTHDHFTFVPPQWTERVMGFSVDGPDSASYTDVQCLAVADCFAGGYVGTPDHLSYVPLLAHLTSAGWSTITLPIPPGLIGSGSSGLVGCRSDADCVVFTSAAVPNGPTAVVADTLANGQWTSAVVAAPTPDATDFRIERVSCSSTGFCLAVGSYLDAQQKKQLVSYALQGSTWVPSLIPDVWGSGSTPDIRDLRCLSSTVCVAAGSAFVDGVSQPSSPLVEVYDSGTWLGQVLPIPTGMTAAMLFQIVCSSTSSCTAYGSGTTGSGGVLFREIQTASGWVAEQIAAPADMASGWTFESLGCASDSACVIVDPSILVKEGWAFSNGTWTGSATQPIQRSAGDQSWDTSCVSATYCVTVGDEATGAGGPYGFAQIYDGTAWTASYISGDDPSAYLFDVSCPSTTNCVGVGYASDVNAMPHPFAAVTTSSGLTEVPLPVPAVTNPSTSSGVVNAISCATVSFCGVTGWSDYQPYGSGYVDVDVNGTWSLTMLPMQPAGISCPAAGTCVAVGSSSAQSSTELYASTMTSGAWKTAQLPLPQGATDPSISAVSCVDSSDCTAVGLYVIGNTSYLLQERLASGAWTASTIPQPAGLSSTPALTSISCTAAQTCLMAGNIHDPTYGLRQLLVTVSGTTVTAALLPLAGTGQNWGPNGAQIASLPRISCHDAATCMVVSDFYAPFPVDPVAWIKGASGWQLVSPVAPNSDSGLMFAGVSCPATGDCFVGGSAVLGAANLPTIFQYY